MSKATIEAADLRPFDASQGGFDNLKGQSVMDRPFSQIMFY